jgi:hypothetical protein
MSSTQARAYDRTNWSGQRSSPVVVSPGLAAFGVSNMALSVENARKRSALFSVADRQMEGIISQEQFDRSLVLAVLFQPYILVPDIFFFISSLLNFHFNERPMSLFERALQNGIIIPSFRSPE